MRGRERNRGRKGREERLKGSTEQPLRKWEEGRGRHSDRGAES